MDPKDARAFGRQVDFGRTASDYGTYRAGFPEAFFDRLATLDIGRPGQRILDLGTGTGTVARGLARKGADVVGTDPSAALLDEARRLDAAAGVHVDYCRGRAEEIGFADASFDAVTAGQCWHWFDRERAAAEVFRVLKPGGQAVVAHFDWIPLPGNLVERTEALICRHNPSWRMGGGTGIHPQWLSDLSKARFRALETFSFDLDVEYAHIAWRRRIQASAGVKASLSAGAAAKFDAQLADILAAEFPDDPLAVLHRVWAVIARKPEGT